MRVSDFPIGRGEVYVVKYPHMARQTPEFIEIVAVQPARLFTGRHILIASHVKGRRVDGSERIVFGATALLRSYRPATSTDCRRAEAA